MNFWEEQLEKVHTGLKGPGADDTYAHETGTDGVAADLTKTKQMEDILGGSEEQFRLLVDRVKDYAIFMLDPAGYVVTWNSGAERIKGYRAEEIIGKHFSCFYLPADIEAGKPERGLKIAEAEGRFETEGWRVRQDGSRFWSNVVITALRDNSGNFRGFAKVSRDVTEHKQAKEALRLSEERFAKAFRASPDGISINRVSDSRIIEVNDRWCSLFGYSRAEVIGRTWIELNIYINPADRQLFLSQLEAQGFVRDLEMALRRKSGEVRQMNVSSERLLVAGEPCTLSFNRDITQRKQMEERLSEERNLLRTLIDTLPDSIYIKDAAGRHRLVNRAAVQGTGFTMEQMLGKTDLELYPPDLAQQWYADDMAVIHSGQPLINQEEPGFDESGREGWDLSTKVPFYDGHGNIAGLVGVTRDITEQKRAEEKLKETLAELTRSNTELEQFAYVVSHDLQEPLRMVSRYTQLLARRYKGKLDADAEEFIAFAVEGASRMKRLLDDLLAYSRVNTKRKPLQPTSSETILAHTLANLELAIDDNQAVITHDPLPTVLADETQLLQLFQNLIGNALKFRAEAPPQVHISAQPRDHEWLFSVRDNGIGLDPKFAERIFVIFQRLHSRDEYPGTGIGLAICKRIVEQHGGHIWVESQPGQGATFYFTLPGAKAAERYSVSS